jgi:hypothetical protein
VLRSLIELSYESSIMATALDVAEAVAAVLPAKRISGAAQLDDVIRKQLGDAKDKSVARKTAVTDNKPPSTATLERGEHSTGLFRKIGDDGISQLEEVDPTAVAAPRARRLSEQPMPDASSADSGLHKLLDAHFDADRRTEVGGPPTGNVPKSDLDPVTPPPGERSSTKSVTADVTPKKSRAPLAIGAVVVAAAGGFGIYKLTHKTPATVVAPPPRDAQVAEQWARLEIDPTPEGATGTITGPSGDVHPFGPTSHELAKKVTLKVTANAPLKIHIEAPGYQPFDETQTFEPNVVYVITQKLQKARAMLHVVTTPSGAQVSLAGRTLGDTPLTVTDLDANPHATLTIAHAGYEPQKLEVDLEIGKTTEVTRELKELAKMGTVRLSIKGAATWAEVYYKGKDLGRNRTISGATTFHLPVGKQTIVLENPSAKKKKTVTIDVKDGDNDLTETLD